MSERAPDLLTIALEDYFQVAPLHQLVPQGQWYRFERRVEKNTLKTLDLLDQTASKATFFTLGWIAEEMPELLATVVSRGHEIATKGYFHRSLQQFDREELREDLVRSREVIEAATGQRLAGFRVAHGWFREEDLWALDVIRQQGFDYDSSVRPMFRSFGRVTADRFPHVRETAEGKLWEFPLSSFHVAGWSLPVSGGNYHRQFPDLWTRWAVERWHRKYDSPFLMYFHVWDLDPDQPRIEAAPLIERVRQYRNLDKMEGTIRHALGRYDFHSIAGHLDLDLELVASSTSDQVSSRPAGSLVLSSTLSEQGDLERLPVSVVVPCFNEEPVLGYLANTLTSMKRRLGDRYELNFIFVDDGSADRTFDCLNETFGEWGAVVLRHERNRGVAAAIMTGIDAAKTEIVASIDADCTYDPHQLGDLLALMTDGVTMVTASPYHREGRVVNVSPRRLFLSRTLSGMYSVVLAAGLATYTSCFRVYRRSVVNEIRLREEGFLGVAELLGQLILSKETVVEAPAVLESRLLGNSKMKIVRTAIGHLKLLARLTRQRLLPVGPAGRSHQR